jgi:SNF2 family DNA or RNA helicase
MKTPTIKYIHIPIRISPLDIKELKVYVDRSRFKEGEQLFSEGKVSELKVDKGRGKAIVQDKNTYHINFQIHQHGSNVCCSCESFQDWELFCSHLVAAILSLNKENLADSHKNENSPSLLESPEQSSKTPLSLKKYLEKWLSIRILEKDLIGELRLHPSASDLFEVYYQKEEQALASFYLPLEYLPELLLESRNIQDLRLNKDLQKLRVLREKEVKAILEAKMNRQYHLELIASFEIQEDPPPAPPTRCKWEVLKKHRVGKNWVKWKNIFFPLTTIDPLLTPFFNGKKPLEYPSEEVPAFLLEQLPKLKAIEGFEPSSHLIETQIIRHAPLHLEVTSTGKGWFHLDPRYGTEKHSISLKHLLTPHSPENENYIKDGNRWYEIQKPLLRTLQKFFENHTALQEGKEIRFTELLQIAEKLENQLEGIKLGFSGERKILGFLEGIPGEVQEYPVPKTLKGKLRPYQIEGYRWLHQLFDWGLNGILADDMGLGKTHQALALLCALEPQRQKRSTLIICPTSVLHHWEQKIKAFAPSLSCRLYHNHERQTLFDEADRPSVVLTTYGLLGRDPHILEQEWFLVILDEAQKIKNPGTQVSKKARMLQCAHRIALTGTPIENRLEELWTIFDFLMPGYLGTLKEFHNRYEFNPNSQATKENKEQLLHKIRPFKVRRVKSQVLSDLPEKIEIKRYVDLTPEQVTLYKQVIQERAEDLRQKIQKARTSKEIPYMHIFGVLTKLKQICDHPHLLHVQGSSGKYDLLLEMLENYIEQDRKVVIFSHFVKMIDIFENHFRSQNIDFRTLTGSTRSRTSVIHEFQNDPKVKVFLCSLLAGGLGIDLTACDTVFHYDRWWNAAREDQATDRVHRIGQTRGVMVHKLITRGTLEEKIDLMISEKKNLANSIIEMDDGSHLAKFSRDQLLELLSLDENLEY